MQGLMALMEALRTGVDISAKLRGAATWRASARRRGTPPMS